MCGNPRGKRTPEKVALVANDADYARWRLASIRANAAGYGPAGIRVGRMDKRSEPCAFMYAYKYH